jgi:hypothetical protein
MYYTGKEYIHFDARLQNVPNTSDEWPPRAELKLMNSQQRKTGRAETTYNRLHSVGQPWRTSVKFKGLDTTGKGVSDKRKET